MNKTKLMISFLLCNILMLSFTACNSNVNSNLPTEASKTEDNISSTDENIDNATSNTTPNTTNATEMTETVTEEETKDEVATENTTEVFSVSESPVMFSEISEHNGKIYFSIENNTGVYNTNSIVSYLPESIKDTAGEFAFVDNYIYYTDKIIGSGDVDKSLYRCKEDGTENELIFGGEYTFYAVDKNKVYYSAITSDGYSNYAYNLSDKSTSLLCKENSIFSHSIMYDNKNYYIDDDTQLLSYYDFETNGIVNTGIKVDNSLCGIENNYAYCIDERVLFKVNLSDYSYEDIYEFLLTNSYDSFAFKDNVIYGVFKISDTMRKYSIDNNEFEMLYSGSLYSIDNVVGDYVLFKTHDETTITYNFKLYNTYTGEIVEIGSFASPSA
ncbi:MAG: DUF5050 domain-containing protein [Acutalibacteraceae bacterium]|nr:DUF5050 domain-containing protein [Acutalibacteraceae bacterium]